METPKDEAGQIIGWSLGGRSSDKRLEDLLNFPTTFTIKVILHTEHLSTFGAALQEEVSNEAWDTNNNLVVTKGSHSKSGKYTTLLLSFDAQNADVIYAVYAFVQTHPLTNYVL